MMTEDTNEIEQDIFADSTEELENNSMEDEMGSNEYKLPSGDALNEKELYLLTAKKDTRIIYVLGPVGSGKTTFLNALSHFIPKKERIITIEDSAELQIQGVANLVRLEARQENGEGENGITIRDLIRTSLRMRP